MTAKLQALADALTKSDPELSIVDTVHFAGGVDERRTTTIMRGGTTVGFLTQTGAGRFEFSTPDDAKFNDVAPVVQVLNDENVKLGDLE